ncbi:MAG: hypothetical protein J5829_06040 [Lachnospiraceae bacterium]|nr:hypothetical protein [Lachnospiraceae bacterium]
MKSKSIKIGIFIGLAVLMTVIVHLSLGGKNQNYDAFPTLDNDVTSMSMIMKSVQENGWSGIYFNPRIGAPDERSNMIDVPGVDSILAFEMLSINTLLRPSTPRLLYYVLIVTFITTAWTMAWLLFRMGFDMFQVFAGATLFSTAPFHFYRWLEHLAISNALTVPLVFLIAFYMIGFIKYESKKKMIAELTIAGLLIGLGCPYFLFFGMIVWVVAIICRCIRDMSVKAAVRKLWPMAAAVIGFIITRIPAFIFNLQNGKNTSVYLYTRSPAEQEMWGLKIIQLFVPVNYSRVPFLSNIAKAYNSTGYIINENISSGLGMVGCAGFIILCVCMMYSFIRKTDRSSENWTLIDFLSLTMITLLLTSAIGGFGEIFNYLVTPMIRCYNRSSVLISCMCIVVVVFFMDRLKKKNRDLSILCMIALLLFGLNDQVRLPYYDYRSTADTEQEKVYSEFFGKVQNMKDNDMIYQLPYYDYPEAGPYKPFIGYLYTDNIRWSFGGIAGRDTKAKELYIDNGMSTAFLDGIRKAGFKKMYIDTDFYTDGGNGIIGFYKNLGTDFVKSSDGKLYVFDI